jgi:hypothetical protein
MMAYALKAHKNKFNSKEGFFTCRLKKLPFILWYFDKKCMGDSLSKIIAVDADYNIFIVESEANAYCWLLNNYYKGLHKNDEEYFSVESFAAI